MKEEERIIYISGLIVRSMTEELTESEQTILNSWIAENQKSYEKIVLSKNFLFDYSSKKRFKTRHGLSALRRKISYTTPLRRFLYISKRVAAVALPLLIVVLSGISIWRNGDTEKQTVMAAQDITRSNKAQLILENGQVLDLNEKDKLQSPNFDVTQSEITYKGSDTTKATRNTILVPVGGVFTVKLADGTVVNLNSDSKLVFPTVFDGSTREVYLTGEAYFSVVKGSKPFIVRTNLGQIKVYGTEFNLKQYAEDQTIHATLVKGSISYSNGHVIPETLLEPNHQLNYANGDSRCSITRVETSLYTAWRHGVFCFEEETLFNIMQTLSRWYGVKFEIRDNSLRNKRLSGQLGRYSSIKSFVEMFNLYDGISCRMEGESMIIIE